jgi:hypothetical protein
MGIRATWIAVRGVDKVEVFERLGFVDTEEEADDGFEPSYAQLPGGWLAVLYPGGDDPDIKLMEALSIGGQAVACAINETVMHSWARGYRDGEGVWSVEHDGGEQGCHHLDVVGDLPPEFAPIRDRLIADQAKEDAGDANTDYVFDLPAELTYALCGYRADGQAMPGGWPTMTLLHDPNAGRRAVRGPAGGGLFKALAGLFRRS